MAHRDATPESNSLELVVDPACPSQLSDATTGPCIHSSS